VKLSENPIALRAWTEWKSVPRLRAPTAVGFAVSTKFETRSPPEQVYREERDQFLSSGRAEPAKSVPRHKMVREEREQFDWEEWEQFNLGADAPLA
jgi:hypothetical protein